MEKLIKTKSYFTVKGKRHQRVPDGIVTERDYMTLNGLGNWDGKTFPYGEGNFKMVSGNQLNVTRKHAFGKWDRTESGSTVWTYGDLDNISTNTAVSSGVSLQGLPNKTSLLSFAYYGSCAEAVRNTITSIIKKFPGEIYFGNVYNGEDDILDGKCQIKNPFGIDFTTNGDIGKNEVWKSFANSSSNYEIIDNSGETIGDAIWNIDFINPKIKCFTEGELITEVSFGYGIVIQEKYYNGRRIFIGDGKYSGYHIRLKREKVKELLLEFSDEEKTLLDFTTQPLFTATFDYPHEDSETGRIVTYQKKFTWPTDGGWNIDITSSRYAKYVEGLLEIADFYDEYYTDNLWRSMTHDAIKSMDRTFISDTEDSDDYNEGTSRIEALIHSYGNFFDKFKFCIDSLKNINKVTYDKNGNSPVSYLSSANELGGWDMTNPVSTLDALEEMTYPSDSVRTIKRSDAEEQFLRNLRLNSKSILSKKGTKEGIEELLALFGLESDTHAAKASNTKGDYSITEYVAVLKPNSASTFELSDTDGEFDLETYNQMKATYPESTDGNGNDEDTLDGLPVRILYSNGKKYLIPWFFSDTAIDGEPYFQMYGGWGKRYEKAIDTELAPDKESICNGVFEETEKYLKYVNSISELENILVTKVSKGDIFYVNDIKDYQMVMGDVNSAISHYFICIDTDNIGNIETGWENISTADIQNGKGNGIKVLYLETLIDEIKGNNPHVGYGKYDDGKEYFEIFRQLFKYSIENNSFKDGAYENCNTDELKDAIRNAGYDVQREVIDNVKCWYFKGNSTNNENLRLVLRDTYSADTFSTVVGKGKYLNGDTLYKSELEPFDFETKESTSNEMASYSVMNTKRMEIHFFTEKYKDEKMLTDFKRFINTDVMPYLKQMIPSTTIWWMRIGDERFGAQVKALDKLSTLKKYKVDGTILKQAGEGEELKTFEYRKKINTLVDIQANGKSI